MTEDEFDALLANALGPPARPADRGFVTRVDAAIAEAERFRGWRRRALRRVGSEALVLLALAGAAATLARAPDIAEALAGAPFALPAVAGAVIVAWLALTQQRAITVVG